MSDLTEHVEQAALARVGASSNDHMNTAAQTLSSPLIWKVIFHICLQLPNSCVHCSRQNTQFNASGLKNNIQTSLTNFKHLYQIDVVILHFVNWNDMKLKGHGIIICTERVQIHRVLHTRSVSVKGKDHFSWPLIVALQPVCNSQRKEMVCDRLVPWRTMKSLNSPETVYSVNITPKHLCNVW